MLQFYGTIFRMKRGNPFKLKALMDKWPDFNTVVVRPQEQIRCQMYDLNHYTNTYQIYSKDRGSQSSLDEAIKNLVAIQGKVKHTQGILYMAFETARERLPSLLKGKLSSDRGKFGSTNQEMFKLLSLDVTHAALANKFWHFGSNERIQRFIECCIQTFPSFWLLGPEGTPVSWTLVDQTEEQRMAGTVPQYRRHGLIFHVLCAQVQALTQLGFPVYSHVYKGSHTTQRVVFKMQDVPIPSDWNQ
ncbi:Glycine N-acyltransferase [Pteropus alecto]|uniref:Glycine N-acyltransferase-like protein n=1 Tax=Pteropus alecto TaxID=9402 RepID=L5K7C5_PTEAL|nr:Glycine N-acyltransferase [Pteropus alecto]